MSDPVVIVGASLAGATAAATLREAGFAGDITLIGGESELPYERPALSKGYLTGRTAADVLAVHQPSFYPDNNITVRLGQTAVGLDHKRRRVVLAGGRPVRYGTLVIATGVHNIQPRLPGLGLPGVFQLRTLADADAIRAAMAGARTAVTIGMGFIGCEIAATLTGYGLQVTAVDAAPGPLWGPLGPQLSALTRRWHEERGVRVLAGQGVGALLPGDADSPVAVLLASGERLSADLVVVGVGTRPSTGWLADAPVHLDGGAVAVDSDGRTNLPDVWAVGDVAAPWDHRAGAHARHEHWASAISSARRAAHCIAGAAPEPESPPYFWSDQYDRTLQYTGAHHRADLLVVRGDLVPDQPFTAFYLRDGIVTAVLAVNDGRQFRRGQRLIGRAVHPGALRDPAVDLRHLAAAGADAPPEPAVVG